MTAIGIVIVSYNTCALLRDCLASLRGCALPLRTVVVDNASRDGSAAMVRAQFPEAELLALAENAGFARGTNIGIQHLLDMGPAPDYLLMLNPDTVVHPGAIETLAAFLDAHPRVGAVGPRLLNPDGSTQAAAFRFPTLMMTVLDLFPPGEALPGRLYNSWWHGRYPQERGDAPFPIDHPLGACILTRRSVLEQVGLLDEGFFMYAEEVDWCFRVRQASWSIWQTPAARVTHVGGASTSQFRARMLVALYHSRLRFFRKHYPPATVRRHLWVIRAGMLRAVLRAWRAYAQGSLPRDTLRAQLWAFGQIMQET
ncbi:MAG: glycosyltransferase family 2 protein [Roseiflexaceae bacterium]